MLRSLALIVALAVPAAWSSSAAANPPRAGGTAAVLAKLRAQRLGSVSFDDAPLLNVVAWLRVATGLNFHVKQHVLIKEGIEAADIRIRAQLSDIAVTDFLQLVLEPHGLVAVVKDNVIYITTRRDSVGKPITRIYGIAHITWQKVDFHAPPLDLRPSGFTPTEEYQPEVVDESDPLAEGEAVAELVRSFVDPEGWAENGDWALTATQRYLIVRAPAHIHRAMPGVLARIAAMK